MKDIQNIVSDYNYKIDKVGVNDIIHPIKVLTKSREQISTVGRFNMGVSLSRCLKGINMSRLPLLLEEFYDHPWKSDDLKDILELMTNRMESDDAYIEMAFDYFIKKKAPVTQLEGIMPYKCKFEASLEGISDYGNEKYDFILTVEVPIHTLCPCSKEISTYSAHNQRGYVLVSVRYSSLVWIEEIIELVESVSSCELYSVLKREDEKYVTEKAYENPRFVEDVVRMVAEKLNNDSRFKWFKVSSRHQESIHAHDAYASIERWCYASTT